MVRRRYERWAGSLAEVVASVPVNDEIDTSTGISVARITQPGSEFVTGLGSDVTFHGFAIGRQVSVIGVSGEVVSEYAHYIRGLTKASVTMCAGCIDHTFGYIPTHQMIQEGGYEGGGYCRDFSLVGLNPEIERNTKKALDSLACILP